MTILHETARLWRNAGASAGCEGRRLDVIYSLSRTARLRSFVIPNMSLFHYFSMFYKLGCLSLLLSPPPLSFSVFHPEKEQRGVEMEAAAYFKFTL